MGNLNSTATNTDNKLLNEKLIYIEQLEYQGVGQIKIYKLGEKNDAYVMSTYISSLFDNFSFRQLENRMKLSHPHLMQALGVDIQSNLPSNSRFFYQFSYTQLDMLITERLGTTKLFPEEDILALIKGIASCLSFLQDNQITHGDIHPSSIYFDVTSGSFKMYDKELLAGRGSGYLQAIQMHKMSYLSPELIVSMREKQYEIPNDVLYKSDIFSLGMCALEAATLQKSKDCYDHYYSLLDSVIQEKMQFVASYYSQELYQMINLMLQYDYKQRVFPNQFMSISSKLESTKKCVQPAQQQLQQQYPPPVIQHQDQQQQYYQQGQPQQYQQQQQQQLYQPPQMQLQKQASDQFIQQQQQQPMTGVGLTTSRMKLQNQNQAQEPVQQSPQQMLQKPFYIPQNQIPQKIITIDPLTQKQTITYVYPPPQTYAPQQFPPQQIYKQPSDAALDDSLSYTQQQPQQQLFYLDPQTKVLKPVKMQPEQRQNQLSLQQQLQKQFSPQVLDRTQVMPQQQIQQQQYQQQQQQQYQQQQQPQIQQNAILSPQKTIELYEENQYIFSNNIQQIKDEIARSKNMIDNYQKTIRSRPNMQYSPIKSDNNVSPLLNNNNDYLSPKFKQQNQYQQQQQEQPQDPQMEYNNKTQLLEQKIKSVIQKSQQIRENYN